MYIKSSRIMEPIQYYHLPSSFDFILNFHFYVICKLPNYREVYICMFNIFMNKDLKEIVIVVILNLSIGCQPFCRSIRLLGYFICKINASNRQKTKNVQIMEHLAFFFLS